MVLEMSHEHEYHFSNKFALWFYALAVHIGRIRNKYKERSEIGKYSKQRQNGANFEHVHCMSVCGSRKKFGLENVNMNMYICREQTQNTHRRCNALGESASCAVCISSPRATYAWLSVNLTDVGGHYGCVGGADSWTLRRELKAESSRRRGSSPWASPSPRAIPCALTKRGFTESWGIGSRRSSWLTVKILFSVVK
jgi:hypothetical protein